MKLLLKIKDFDIISSYETAAKNKNKIHQFTISSILSLSKPLFPEESVLAQTSQPFQVLAN